MFGSGELYNMLNVGGVTATVDTYQTYPAIFEGLMLPGDMTIESKTINFYRYAPVSLADQVRTYSYCVHCRAKTYYEADLIASAVYTALNRQTGGDCGFTCKSMAIIPPSDERDNYNIPLEVLIKKVEIS